MDLDPSIENGSVSMDGKWIRIINPCPFKKKLSIIQNESTARHAPFFLRYHNFMSMARVDLLKKMCIKIRIVECQLDYSY